MIKRYYKVFTFLISVPEFKRDVQIIILYGRWYKTFKLHSNWKSLTIDYLRSKICSIGIGRQKF